MKTLRKKGISYKKISDMFNCSPTTVMNAVNPKFNKQHKEYQNKYQNERYHNDKKFRKKMILDSKKNFKRILKENPEYRKDVKKWQKEYHSWYNIFNAQHAKELRIKRKLKTGHG